MHNPIVNEIERLPKIVAADVELGNFLMGVDKIGGTGREASRLLLSHMPGVMPTNDVGAFYAATHSTVADAVAGSNAYDARDFGRKWQTCGGCSYIDSDHLEICTPETTNAWDFVAAYYAQLMIARQAQRRVSEELPEGMSIQVLVCNSDGRGNSWGSHLNFLLTRRAFLNIFERRMHYLLWLASYQASSVIINGLGKVGSEKAGYPVAYQLSQRADFFEEIVSFNTMVRRPIINSRDESHCYPISEYARFHHIACDSNLCPVANLLKVGVLQIMLAMVEAESDWVCPSVLLESPLDAWIAFSHDPTLAAKARTIDGTVTSALDLQRRLFDAASSFCAAGGCEGVVPRAGEILALWGETLDLLVEPESNRQKLAARLDWVLKQTLLEEAFETSPGLNWESPQTKYLDLLYSSLSEEDGLFWPCLDGGFVDQVVDRQRIELLTTIPPEDTRAFTRGHLIRGHGDYHVEHANWDSVRIRFNAAGAFDPTNGRISSAYGRVFTVYMDAPFGSTLQDNPSLAQKGGILRTNISDDFRAVTDNKHKDLSTWNSENVQSKQLTKKRK